MSEVRQINLPDEEIARRLLAYFDGEPFVKPLIASHIMGHREGDAESTEWIRTRLWPTEG